MQSLLVKILCFAALWSAGNVLALAENAADAATTVESNPSKEADRFDVLEYRVLGNTVLAQTAIEQAVYQFLGEKRSFEDINAARDALAEAYRTAGYGAVAVDIPEQDVSDGVVRLAVTEGRVARLRITGARFFANGKIRSKLTSAQPGEVLNVTSLQSELAAVARQSQDRQITPILRAGATPGQVDLELKVADKLPLHGRVEVNDRYTADTTSTRVSANLSYDNLWQRFHSFSMQYQDAPEELGQARVIAGTYVMPVPNTSHILALYAVDTNSAVTTVGNLAVLGAGRIYGARYVMPLEPMASILHSLTLGADYKNFRELIRLSTQDDITPVSYLTWSLNYSGTWRSDDRTLNFSVGPNFGIRGLANSSAEFRYKRFDGSPSFIYLRGNLQYEAPAFAGTRLVLRVAGQYSPQPLISNEQFGIGGLDSVRGYLESEDLGDYGFSSTVELRSPTLRRSWLGANGGAYFFGFLDNAAVGLIKPLGQAGRSDLSSWGLGLRLTGFNGLEAGLEWATPFVPSDHTRAGESRLHLRVSYGF